jgi:hypothetical protein
MVYIWVRVLIPRCPAWGTKALRWLVSEIEWPEQVSGMAVGGSHARADLLMEGRLQPAAQLHTAGQPARRVSGLGRLALEV